MANTQSISVPVKLEVLRSSIADLEKILNSLQPNTSGWRALSKIISLMNSEALKLLAQMSVPFSSLKQFNASEKTIDKLEQAAARVKVVMEGLQFSDLKLTPAQLEDFKKFEAEIEQIRKKYIELLDTVKKELLSRGKNESLISGLGNINGLLSDFATIKGAVDQHVADLESAVAKQQAAFEKLKSNIDLGERATVLTSSGGGLTREALGDTLFNKFLTEKGGVINFKGGTGLGRENLMRAIEAEFKLEPMQLLHLAQGTYDLINAAFQAMGASKANPFLSLINAGNKGTRERGAQWTQLEELRTQLKEYETLLAEMAKLLLDKLDPTKTVDAGRITEIQNRMQLLQQTILLGVTANSSYQSSLSLLMSQFPQLRAVLDATNAQFLKMQRITMSFNSMKMAVVNFMGFNQVLQLTKRAVKEAANHIKELDSVMNKISIVTNMSTGDLWGQIEQYSAMALKYGVSIKGAYEVSQIYYQQGLETKDVLTLTNETLKLAKVSGLDYAASTDYMTTAIRGFKMEMSEAATVVDVYSNLAANTAVSLEELAVAMSKTASSMESVGATFQEASAMIATMVAVTRESSTNIGSAMKSIASRYGEMKEDPTKMTDSEGEELSYNKVDKALQSVGITLKTTEGQFRDFTDVIIELGEKWDQLESTQQRYIATLFAGNRQQSRFLALVSNIDLLKKNINVAENSEDVGTLQAIKALDSLESKIEQVRVAYQQFYTTIGIESVWKGLADGLKNVVNTLNRMPKLFNTIPVGAINAIINVISVLKSLALRALQGIAKTLGLSLVLGITSLAPQAQAAGENWFNSLITGVRGKLGMAQSTGQLVGNALTAGFQGSAFLTSQVAQYDNRALVKDWTKRLNLSEATANPTGARYDIAKEMQSAGLLTAGGFLAMLNGGPEAAAMLEVLRNLMALTATFGSKLGGALMGIGSALNIISLAIDTSTLGGKRWSGALQGMAGAAILAGVAFKALNGTLNTIPWMAIASGILAVVNGITMLLSADSLESRLEELTQRAEDLGNKAKELKANYNTLESSTKKIKELELARYDSAEAAEEYQEAVDKVAELFPELISGYDAMGNAIMNAVDMEDALTTARQEAAEAALAAAQAEAQKAEVELEKKKKTVEEKGATFSHGEKRVSNGESGYADGAYIGDYDALTKLHLKKLSGKELSENELLLYDWLYDALMSDTGYTDEQKQGVLAGTETRRSWSVNARMELLLTTAVKYGNRGDYDLATQLIDLYEQWMDLEGYSWTDSGKKLLNEWRDAMREAAPYAKTIQAANKKTVNSWLWLSDYATLPMLKNNGVATLVQDKLYDMAAEKGNFTSGALENYASEILDGLNGFWTGLSDVQQKQLGELWEHPEKYTKTDFYRTLDELGLSGVSGIPEWALEIFGENSDKNKTRLRSKALQIYGDNYLVDQDYVKWHSVFGENADLITLNESLLLTAGLNQLETMKSLGLEISEFVTDFLNIYAQIAELPAEARNALIEQFINNGFTKEGLAKTKKYIEETEALSGIDTTPITNISDRIIPNIVASTQAMTHEFTSKWEKIEKKFSSFSKGVSHLELDKLISEAQALGINVTEADFVQSGEKWVLRADKFTTVVDEMSSAYTEQFDGQADALDAAYKKVSTMTGVTNFGNDKFPNLANMEELQTVLGSHFTEVFEQNPYGDWVLRKDTKYVDKTNRYWQWENIRYDNEVAAGRTEGLDEARKILEEHSGFLQTEEEIAAGKRIFGQAYFDKMYQWDEERQGYTATEYAVEEVLTTNDAFKELIDTSYQEGSDALTEMSTFFSTMSAQLKKTAQWKKGDYSSLTTLNIEGDAAKFYESADAAYEHIKLLATGAVQMTDEERLQPDIKSAVENYLKGYSTLLSDLTSKGIDYVRTHLKDYEGIAEADLDIFKEDSGKSYVELVRTASQNAGKTVAEVNKEVAAAIEKQNKTKLRSDAAGLVSGGFTISEFANYLAEYSPETDLSKFVTDDGKLKGKLANVFEYDADSGSFKKKAGTSVKQVVDALESELGVKIEEDSKLYRDLVKEAVDEAISEADSKDKTKSRVSQLTNLAKGKVGDRIDIHDLSENMVSKLTESGLEVTDGYVHITSQKALNDAILALEELKNDPELTDIEKGLIDSMIAEVKSKYNKSTALSNLIGETVTADAALTWAVIMGMENDVAGAMSKMGFTWSDTANAYVAGADAVAKLEELIRELETSSDATDPKKIEEINAMKTKLHNLRNQTSSKLTSALKDIYTNYQAVTDEMITSLADSFKLPKEKLMKYFLSRGDGTYTAKVDMITADLESGVLQVQDGVIKLLNDTIESTVSAYLGQFETAIENAGQAGKNSEILARAERIFALMTEQEKTAAGITSAKDLMEWSAEEGGYRLNETGRKYEVARTQDLSDVERIAGHKRSLLFHLKERLQRNLTIDDAYLTAWMEQQGIDVSETEELQYVMSDWITRAANTTDYGALRDAMLQEIADATEKQRQALADDLADSAIQTIAAFDFEGMAAGTVVDEDYSKARLRELLTHANVPQQILDSQFDAAYAALKEGDWSKWDEMVKGTKVEGILSTDTLTKLGSSNYEQYVTALDEAYDKPLDKWSLATKQLKADMEAAEGRSLTAEEFIGKIHSALDTSTLESASDRASRNKKKQERSGKYLNESLYHLIENGSFSVSDLESFMSSNGLNIEDYFNYETLSFTNADMAAKWHYNAATQKIEAVVTDSSTWLQDAWNQAGTLFNTTVDTSSNEALAALRKAQSDLASKLNELNQDLITASEIKGFVSSDLNNWVSVYTLPAEVLSELEGIEGIERNGALIRATTETARIAAIRKIAENRDKLTDSAGTALTASQQLIEDALAEVEKTYNTGETIKNLMSASVSRDVAKTAGIILGWGETLEAIDQHMQELGFVWDKTAQSYIHDGETFEGLRGLITDNMPTTTKEEKEHKIDAETKLASLETAGKQIRKQYDALTAVINAGEKVSEELIGELAKSLGAESTEEVAKYFDTDAAGNKKFNLTKFLSEKPTNLNEETLKLLAPEIGKAIDTTKKAISTAASDMFTGTTDEQHMASFTDELNKLLGTTYKQEDLFNWDPLLQAYTLDLEKFTAYKDAKMQELIALGKTETEANDEIDALTKSVAAKAVDLRGFLSADNRKEGSIAYAKFKKQLTDYYALTTGKTGQALDEYVQSLITMFENGGEDAVKAIQEIAKSANIDLTDADIQSYYAPVVSRLMTYRDAILNLVVGQYIAEGDLRDILSAGDVGIVDAQTGLVTSVDNLAAAYLAIYTKLTNTATATGATLQLKNDTYAKYLAALDLKETDAISALGNAMGMTYDEFANLLTKSGKDLKSTMDAASLYGIEKLGNGKIRIKDFTSFASYMGWSPNSEEYMSAFKTYNDSLIELNRKTEKSILDEVKSVSEAKGGDWLNLTYLTDALLKVITGTTHHYLEGQNYGYDTDRTAFDDLNAKLALYGATIENGILKLGENANLIGVAKAIGEAAQSAGLEISSELAEIADAIKAVLQSYVEAITKGIEGGLSNVEKTDLISKAKSLGVDNLRFEETAEGFRLALASAIELYQTVSKIDKLQGKVVFDKLSTSLQENNENFATTTALLNHIQQLRMELNAIDSNISSARREEYEAELAVAQQIAAVRSTMEDSSWNFMSNKIPGGQNNPLNYAKNWTQALGKIRDAYKVKKGGKTGFMDYTDFYNIITELNNMAGQMGKAIKLGKDVEGKAYELDGSLEAASALIQAGASSLTAVDSGDVMVNLGSLGISLANGASSMEAGITEGVQSIAHSLVEALNGMIAMLELIVAMEALGDIDADDDMNIELPEITADGQNLSEGFKSWRDNLIASADAGNEDLKAALDGIRIGKQTMREWIQRSADQWTDQDAAILSALYKAAKNGGWDLDNIAGSMQEILNASGFGDYADDFTIDIGDTTFVIQNGIVVKAADWSDKQVQAALADYKKKNGIKDDAEAKANIIEAIQKYLAGEGAGTNNVDLTTIITVRHSTLIKHDNKGNYVVGSDGKTHYYEGSKGYEAILKRTVLEDQQGISGSDIRVNEKEGTAYAEVTYGTKVKTKFKVTVGDDGSTNWSITDNKDPEFADFKGGEYHNLADLLKAMYEHLKSKENHKDNSAYDAEGNQLEYEQWVWAKYGIHIKVKPTVTDAEGNDIADPASNPEIRQLINDLIKTDQPIPYTSDKQGHIIVTLPNGVTIKLNEEDVTVDGQINQEALSRLLQSLLGIDTTLGDTITLSITNAFSGSGGEALSSALSTSIASALTQDEIPIPEIKVSPSKIDLAEGAEPTPIESLTVPATKITVTGTVEPLGEDQVPSASGKVDYVTGEVEKLKEQTAKGKVNWTNVYTAPKIDDIYKTVHWKNVEDNPRPGSSGSEEATGNFGLATGNAKAQGTLMGELGPELVVSGGRYFVAGQNGAEFVDLDPDAIVFNHLQTRSLFENGMSKTRGRAVTNERNAVAFARGNMGGGPAMSSASAALAALKQLRSQWQALESMTAKDLAGKGGGGGGGGGKDAAFIKQLERWYNLLQEIASLEEKITYEQTKRSKIASDFNRSGQEYYNSQRLSLKDLQKEVQILQQLVKEQEAYFKKRQLELNTLNGPFSSLYTFDENGQIKYDTTKKYKDKNGNAVDAFTWLSDLAGGDPDTGKPNYTVEEQYERLKAAGYEKYMQYDENGNKIDPKDDAGKKAAIEAFWAKIEADKQEMQELHDSVEEHKNAVLEKQQQQNELLKEIEDNQLAVEQKVMKAVEDAAKREIDELKDLKDALQKGNEALLKGLSDQLNKERQMYLNQESSNELETKRRRLSILQRSGGSASEIASLQKEIDSDAREEYFNKQQEQIDAIQEASDNELEKLQLQIDIMNETLEYLKEHGLLWSQVYEIMAKSPEEIANFIKENDSSYWGKSPADLARSMRDDLFEAEKWAAFAAEGVDIKDYVAKITEELTLEDEDKKKKEEEEEKKKKEEESKKKKDDEKKKDDGKKDDGKKDDLKLNTPRYRVNYTVYGFGEHDKQVTRTGYGVGSSPSAARAAAEKYAKLKMTGLARPYAKYSDAVKYKKGGLIDYTGPAWVDGSPSEPEAVLNAEQTKLLRDNILSNKPDSLISLLLAFSDAYHGLSSSTYDSISDNSNSVVIEHAEVNMNVAKMNDKYDAKQAGKDVMRELLAISNKTDVRNKVTT